MAVMDCSTQQANTDTLLGSCRRGRGRGSMYEGGEMRVADLLDLVLKDVHNLSDLYQASQLQ